MIDRLDQSQRAFCEAPQGNIRLLAPAGCGKTLCLLFRCKHLAEKARRRPRFLIVTFTRVAKDVLLARINEDDQFSALRDITEIVTLNSWGFRRIKGATFSPRLITSKADYHFAMRNQLQPVWQNHSRVKETIEKKPNFAPRLLMGVIDAFKSLGFDHERHSAYALFSRHWDELADQQLSWRLEEQVDQLTKLGVLESVGKKAIYNAFFKFWRDASAHLVSERTFTIEDQKYFAYLDEQQKLEDGRFLTGAARYHHIFIDEFQDINPLDLRLVRAIALRNKATVTVAGDDDQAIFEWRGATPEYILDPENFFGASFKTYTLAVNYRSPVNIVDYSQRLIANNKRRVEKQTRAFDSGKQARIEIKETASLVEALDYVYDLVRNSVTQGESPSRLAIIGRKRSQIIPYQVYFASKDISFCAAEDLQVFLSDTFGRLLDLLTIKTQATTRQQRRVVVDAMLKLCDLTKRYNLNKKDKDNLKKHLQQSGCTSVVDALDPLLAYRGSLKRTNIDGEMSAAMAKSIRAFVDSTTVSDTLTTLSEHFEGLHTDFGKAADDIFFADPPFLQLAEYASSYKDDYDSFVDDIERARDQLVHLPPFEDDEGPDPLWKRPVHLMTALRAKGKEFDSVILLDVNDGTWPNRHAKTIQQLEAERRVFYVAFTRARKNLVMLVRDHIDRSRSVVSPYISELGLRSGDRLSRPGGMPRG